MVLTIRLLLDSSPSAYLIHSIVVFVDMLLIHLFTFSPWLSASGEIVTIISFLCFHSTNEKVFELLETTMIAALCSMHMINSRKKHMVQEHKLEDSLRIWHQLSLRSNPSSFNDAQQREALLNDSNPRGEERSSRTGNVDDSPQDGESNLIGQNDIESHSHVPTGAVASLHHSQNLQVLLGQEDGYSEESNTPGVMRTIGANFFEHFLDGSAGVMYTSFVGLIVDDLLHYGESNR